MENQSHTPPAENRVEATYTLVYMSICLTCIAWQVINAGMLVHSSRKMLHFAVLAEVLLAFFIILVSLLNPLMGLDCTTRYWISIVCVNLAGILIQSILLYKVYICYNRATWLLWLGSFINCGYLVLCVLYSIMGQVPFHKDSFGNCLMDNFGWPAIAKLALDIFSNLFLSTAFLMVIHRYYQKFENNLYKSLLSSGIIYSAGVVVINIVVGVLIACRAVGGLSSDLYAFEWVVTGYLLIKQFKRDKNVSDEEQETGSRTAHSDVMSIISQKGQSSSYQLQQQGHALDFLLNTTPQRCCDCSNLINPDDGKH